jgi:methyl-accepting chemotaxis protein
LSELIIEWERLRDGTPNWRESFLFRRHSEIIESLSAGIKDIADESQLTVNDSLANHYMSDLSINVLQQFLDVISQSRDVASSIVKRNRFTPDNFIGLSNLQADLMARSQLMNRSLTIMYADEPQLETLMGTASTEVLEKVALLSETLKGRILDPDSIEVDGPEFANIANSAISAMTALIDLNNTLLQQRIDQSVQEEKQEVLVVNGFNLLLVVLCLYAIVALYKASLLQFSSFTKMANSLANNDFSVRIPVTGKDEFSVVAEHFNDMAVKIAQLVNGMSGQVQAVSNSAQKLFEASSGASDNIQSQGLEAQSIQDATRDMLNALTMMSSGVEKIANEANQKVSQSSKTVQATLNGSNMLANEVSEAAKVTTELQKKCEDIGNMVEVIRGIADQTNLLALNAAIEAARAGEQGRGFAVVADEVRTLASRTQEATSDIHSIIEKLQVDAQGAVAVMDRGQELAQQNVDNTQDADKALVGVVNAIDELDKMKSDIISTTYAQQRIADEIGQRIDEIKRMSELSADISAQSSQESRHMQSISEELIDILRQLRV